MPVRHAGVNAQTGSEIAQEGKRLLRFWPCASAELEVSHQQQRTALDGIRRSSYSRAVAGKRLVLLRRMDGLGRLHQHLRVD
jgi:hypothetical protein